MRLLILSMILIVVNCSPKVLTAWGKDEMIIDVLMLKKQGWDTITVDTCQDGTYRVRYK